MDDRTWKGNAEADQLGVGVRSVGGGSIVSKVSSDLEEGEAAV